jgi:hypothetical protein
MMQGNWLDKAVERRTGQSASCPDHRSDNSFMFKGIVLEHRHQNDRDYECGQADNPKVSLETIHGFRHRLSRIGVSDNELLRLAVSTH